MTWKDRGAIAVVMATAFLFFTTTSASADQCGKTESVLNALKKSYNEVVIAQGIITPAAGPTFVGQLLVSPEGTWTFLFTTASGYSCIKAAGQGWAEKPQKGRVPHGPPA